MEMTASEIVRSYKEAKDKKKQVGILAQLNLCTPENIKRILIEGGVDWRELPRGKRTPKAPQKKTQTEHNAQPQPTPEPSTPSRNPIICAALKAYRKQIAKEMAEAQSAHEEAMAKFKNAINEIDLLLQNEEQDEGETA